jgi:L-fuconolactonase
VYRAYGADRLLWASDFPWILQQPGYSAQLALVDQLLPDISPSERAAILGGTARKLLTF